MFNFTPEQILERFPEFEQKIEDYREDLEVLELIDLMAKTLEDTLKNDPNAQQKMKRKTGKIRGVQQAIMLQKYKEIAEKMEQYSLYVEMKAQGGGYVH
ncbi:hypothetical protein [Phocoenobacter atlanticus]|uniref:hypothetical protein n=1 Tax=Phocoenobacter atlanticus TaxID=3416742 RepID=UPI00276F14E8|nr:hypothetical protein [Pasteurella atlantica]MDP8101472.1 hypothetical protein [Pasteurella atlantica]